MAMNKSPKSPVALALGLTLASSALVVSTANAEANPFGMTELSSGYQVAMEGKCGGNKSMEGKCGGDKAGAGKMKEGKCGEGKCGGNK